MYTKPSVPISSSAPGSNVHEVSAAIARDCRSAAQTRNTGPVSIDPVPPSRPSDWLAAASALIAPPACVACRRPPERPADPLCAACRTALPWLLGARCPRCALPAPCGSRCPMAGSALTSAWAPVAFEGPVRAVVHALKFRGALALADLMAAQMVATAPAGLLADGVVLVPVPTPAGRRRGRGFDHAARLAVQIGERTGLEVVPCLRRAGAAPRQAGARRAERLAVDRVRVEVCA